MNHAWRVIAPAIAGLILVASNSSAFDDRRQGFLLGFGAGAGILSERLLGGDAVTGVQTDLKMGWGVSDRWQVFYTGKQIWSYADGIFGTCSFPSIGAAYFLEPAAPSLFVAGAVGGWLVGGIAPGFGGSLILGGPGAFGGVGYEIGRHVYLELDVGACSLPDASGGFSNMALTLNVMGY